MLLGGWSGQEGKSSGTDASVRLDSRPCVNAPRWTRTINPLIKSQLSGPRNASSGNGLRISTPAVAHHLPTDICKNDPDLHLVASVWGRLPEAVRAGIVAMVKAAARDVSRR